MFLPGINLSWKVPQCILRPIGLTLLQNMNVLLNNTEKKRTGLPIDGCDSVQCSGNLPKIRNKVLPLS
jgi:hypothetical protein